MIPQNIFKPKIEVPLDTTVFSDSILFETSGVITSISNNVTLYKNDVVETSPLSFLSGDSIKLAVQSSVEYSDQTIAIVEIEIDTKTTHIFTCVTLSNIRYVPEFADLEPFELTKYFDDSQYVPDNGSNKLSIYKTFDETPFEKIGGFAEFDSLASNVDETDSYVFCSFFDKKILRIDASTNEINGIIKVSGNPYGVVAIPKIPEINYITDLWITIADENKVIVLNNNDQIIREFSVGARPLGISTDGDYSNVWVANSYDNTVTHFKWSIENLDWVITTVNVGEKPFEIACDTNNSAWVTCAADNKVYKITENDVVTSFVVGANPRGVAYNNNKMWVAISQEEKVVALDLSGNIVHILEDVGLVPFAVGAIALPMTYRPNLSDVINILDNVSSNIITESIIFSDDKLSDNRLLENVQFSESLNANRVSDSLSFTESLQFSVISNIVPPVFEEIGGVVSTDPYYNSVSLLLTGEEAITQVAGQGKVSARYLIVEIQDYHAGVGGAINELTLKDENGNTIPYTVYAEGAYDLTTNDVPDFWNNQV